MTRLRAVLDVLLLDGFRAAGTLMWVTLGLTIVNGLAQASFPLGFKLFVDATLAHDGGRLAWATVAVTTLIAVYWMAATLDANIGFGLVDRMELFVSTRIAERVTGVASVEHFQSQDYLRELELLDQHSELLRTAPRVTLAAVSSVVRLTMMMVLLAMIDPWLVLLPLAGAVPAWTQSRSVKLAQRAEEQVSEDRRRAESLFALAAAAGPAKELRSYGLTDVILHRHDALGRAITRRLAVAGLKGALLASAGWCVFVAVAVAGIAVVSHQAVEGVVSPGDVVLAIVLIQQVREILALVATDVRALFSAAATAARGRWLDDYATDARTQVASAAVDRLEQGIVLEKVSFRYPEVDHDALVDVDLALPAGSTVAVVGENGAGKSTLVRLLCHLYSPTSGRITVDGVGFDGMSPARWRDRVSVAFQDHVAYELVAAEVVGIGDLPRVDDVDAVGRALERAAATDLIGVLEGGLATQLGRSFPDGRELSGGQWQKLALGRAMMRDDPLLVVLDEPTASLDAEVEHALFEGYFAAARRLSQVSGAITLIVTHRFSTVRDADLIVVMDSGRVIEVGSHGHLMAGDGHYAELVRLQARGYR